MTPQTLPGYSGYQSGAAGQAYNQTAFRHFLAIERRRAEISRRALFVIIVTLRPGSGMAATLAPSTAKAVFLGLGESVREVDFVGWLRENRTAAAVLAPGVATASPQAQQLLAERVRRAIRARIPATLAKGLHVRIVPVVTRGPATRWNEPVRIASGH